MKQIYRVEDQTRDRARTEQEREREGKQSRHGEVSFSSAEWKEMEAAYSSWWQHNCNFVLWWDDDGGLKMGRSSGLLNVDDDDLRSRQCRNVWTRVAFIYSWCGVWALVG